MTMQQLLSMSNVENAKSKNIFFNILKETKLHSGEGPVSYVLSSADKNKTKLSWRNRFMIQ